MNITVKKVVLLSSIFVSFGSTALPALADAMLSTGGYARQFQKMEMMKMIDADGNHMVTKAEFDSYYGSIFDALNKDNDDSLDTKEWVGTKATQKIDLTTGGYSRELRSTKMMKMMDADSDSKVTKAEFLAHQGSIFSAMDSTADSQLDATEWIAKIVGK